MIIYAIKMPPVLKGLHTIPLIGYGGALIVRKANNNEARMLY
jgi:hypothetical protein